MVQDHRGFAVKEKRFLQQDVLLCTRIWPPDTPKAPMMLFMILHRLTLISGGFKVIRARDRAGAGCAGVHPFLKGKRILEKNSVRFLGKKAWAQSVASI